MTVPVDHLTPVEKTLLITLTGRALDARTKRPLLGDRLADTVCGRIDGDIKVSGAVRIAVAVRSGMLDRIVGGFIAARPNAVVVELGCGLGTRMQRLSPPATVAWYDVDLDDVIALRRRVIPELDRSHLVAASLTDEGWLDGVPRDRPVIVVADGVLGFLTEADNRRILGALTDHFTAGGELLFNAYTPIVARLMGSLGVLRSVGIPRGYRGFGFDDPHVVEWLNPRLTFVEEQLGAQAPEAAQFRWPTRIIAKLFARWRAQGRRGVWIVRYRFSECRP